MRSKISWSSLVTIDDGELLVFTMRTEASNISSGAPFSRKM